MAWKGRTKYNGKKLYKVLSGGKSPHVKNFVWSLPTQLKDGTWKPGKLHVDPVGNLGFHLTCDPASWYCPNMEVYEVEAGKIDDEYNFGGTVVTHSCRLLRRLDEEELFDLDILCERHRVESGKWLAIGDADVTAFGTAEVCARDRSMVTADNTAIVTALDNARVIASGSARVGVHDNATVDAYDGVVVSAVGGSISAFGGATVHAHNATIFASGEVVVSACLCPRVTVSGAVFVRASDSLVEADGNSVVHARRGATVKAKGGALVYAGDGATVEATENAIVNVTGTTKVQACGHAIVISSKEASGVVTITESATHIRTGEINYNRA
jgi:hypothetical protein